MTELEKLVIERMLADTRLAVTRRTLNFDLVVIRERSFSGTGFMAIFEPSEELELLAPDESPRWGHVGAWLNSSIQTGYVAYVDHGCLEALEGFVYAPAIWWPDSIEQIELVDDPG
ncbi:MAG: hypothetical protein ABI867_26715 [Kofleriaceae bacterium]